MKNKNYIYLYLFMISLMFISCKKKEKIEVKGREYITESGFSQETTISIKETKEIETTTEKFDIKKHPELWSMTDKETYIFILNDVLDNGYGQKYIDKLPLSDKFRENRHNGIFDYIEQINRPEDWERYLSASASDEEFQQHLVWICTGSWTMERETLLQYTLDSENRLDSIRVIKSEITKDIVAESESESIANRPKSYDDLERYKKIIPDLFDSKPIDYEYFNEEEANEWRTYIRNYYEGCTDNFFTKYDPLKGIVGNDNEMIYSSNEKEEYTNLENKCVGVTVDFGGDIKKNYKVYFEVDDRNFLDSITKVEEVLDDGTVVEVENNFGK